MSSIYRDRTQPAPTSAVTIFSTVSRARLRHAKRRAGGPDARKGRESSSRDAWSRRAPPPGPSGEGGGAAARLQGGGYVAPLRAVALRARHRRRVELPRFRRSAVPAITLRQWSRLQKGLARPPCLASSHRARPHSRALPPVASPMALRATLECDLARQDLGTYRKNGAERGEPSAARSARRSHLPGAGGRRRNQLPPVGCPHVQMLCCEIVWGERLDEVLPFRCHAREPRRDVPHPCQNERETAVTSGHPRIMRTTSDLDARRLTPA